MDNQHRHIKGYRELSREEIDLMNAIKAHAEHTRELCERVGLLMPAAQNIIDREECLRWQCIARDHLQQGYMALTRAVARPESF